VRVSDVFLNMDMKQPEYIAKEEKKQDHVEQDDDDFERDETDTDSF
jgi:hypothetical protein